MRKLRLGAVMGTLLALLLSGCGFSGIYDVPLPGNKVNHDNGFTVKADFADALNLVPRSSVMVGDVPVGQVESVTRVGWHARVTMLVRKDVILPADAEAQIRQTSLLGEKFVALSAPPADPEGKPAATERLGPNDLIPIARTGRNPEVEEVLGALSLVLTGGGVGQIQSITHELNKMMDGRTGKIRDVLGQVGTLVRTLNSQKGDIVQAMESINGLSSTLVAEKQTIGDALDAAGPAINVLREQHTQLVKMLSELDSLGDVGTRVINETKDDLIAELAHLEPVLRELSDTGDSLVPGLVAAASYPFPMDAAAAIKGDFANVVFKLQIKLTPVSEGGLIPTTLQDVVTLCRATPLAPICSPAGDAVEQLCSVLGSLPLCKDTDASEVAAALANLEKGSGTKKPPASSGSPDKPGTTTPTPGATGGGSGGTLAQLLEGLLGGGSS
ncbi:MCE family protein [Aeromicrobium sp. Root236]|uniref:MCE family protein n=1 Tax=Aeromicrobium sp. Root236 TaxID=1736498 RepID=UPI0009E85F6F|nr:MCE family protein [Aeromicrobium sp. Root236]